MDQAEEIERLTKELRRAVKLADRLERAVGELVHHQEGRWYVAKPLGTDVTHLIGPTLIG